MGEGDNVVVRIGGVVEKHRQPGYVVQQHPRGNDHKVGFAIRLVTRVVEQAQGQAGRGFRHGHDGAHAGVDGHGIGLELVHHILEHLR